MMDAQPNENNNGNDEDGNNENKEKVVANTEPEQVDI
jgi:hypothetical protein